MIRQNEPVARAMYKGELAQAYNPQMEPHYALRTLRKWIETSPGLHDRLVATGFTERQKILTPLQVQLIFDALGAP